jgi:hypothetical protein
MGSGRSGQRRKFGRCFVSSCGTSPGRTGRHVVDLALAAGDATSQQDVAKAMIGRDAVVSALGRSTSVRADGLSFVQKIMYRTFLRDIYADKDLSEKAIRSSGLDWTLVYPTLLAKGPAKGTYRADDRLPMKGNPRIHRDAVVTD